MKKRALESKKTVIQRILPVYKSLKTRSKSIRTRFLSFIDHRPFLSFFGLLALIVVFIIVGNFLRKPPAQVQETQKQPISVEVFSIGTAPRMTFSGTVEKTGAVKLVAQSAGIVQQVNTFAGAAVGKGQALFWLSSNAAGGTIPTIQRQIAEKSHETSEVNYPVQKEMIAKRRDIAHKTDGNQDELRAIAASSIENTKTLVSLNEQIVANLSDQLESAGGNDPTLMQALAGAMGGLQALKAQLKTTEYQAGGDQEPQALSDLGKDVALQQLDMEERGLELSREISGLNLRIAQVMESLSYPASVCEGTVERVHVSYGQAVNPGQPLASLVCNKNVANVVVLVSPDIASHLSKLEKSTLRLSSDKTVELLPRYISTEPTDGNLHSVIFTLPESMGETLSDGFAIPVEMPVGNAQSMSSVPYIPIDAVFQTQTSSIIYIATQSAEGKRVADDRDVTLGSVFGSFVEVRKGLSAADQVIVTRDVIAGDEVIIQ